MPGQVRIAQGRSTGGAYLYLQPAFVNTAQNNRVEVIRDMALHVDAGRAAADFTWTQQAPAGDGCRLGRALATSTSAMPCRSS